MTSANPTRRDTLAMLATSALWTAAAAASGSTGLGSTGWVAAQTATQANPNLERPPGHDRRIQWWRQARYGMFVTWGLFSILGRGEWVMAVEDIPVAEYEKLARQFDPPPNVAREWARLAREAGMKYVLITAKFHDGFCLFDTPTTSFCAPRQAAGRDLLLEFVEAVRAEGLRVSFYFSLMDWHDPDWAVCKADAAARRRFLDRVQAELRLLMTRYGKIDVLWYDGAYPLDAEGWESRKMNAMVFALQPDILINNRSWMAGDFSTPEQTIAASKGDWESCMTLNEHWGYGAADDNWKPAGTVVENLLHCAQGGGNYLLNIGPRADGSVPEASIRILREVGDWLRANGDSLREVKKSQIERGDWVFFSQRGNTLYLYLRFWPGERLTIGGIDRKPKRATLLASGREIAAEVKGTQLIFSFPPGSRPQGPLPVIAAEFDAIPVQNSMGSRIIDNFIQLIQAEESKGWS